MKNRKFDPINKWLDENTGLFGQPLSYQERIEDCRAARGEQCSPRQKRMVYKFYYQQEGEGGDSWMYIGEHDVDNQEELWELESALGKKYKSKVKFNKVSTRW